MLQTYQSPSTQVGEDGSIHDVSNSVQPSLTDLYGRLQAFQTSKSGLMARFKYFPTLERMTIFSRSHWWWLGRSPAMSHKSRERDDAKAHSPNEHERKR
jgi:hypothetical protein